MKIKNKLPVKVKTSWPRRIALISLCVIIFLIISGTIGVRVAYNSALKPVQPEYKLVTVTIPSGSSAREITELLDEKGVIRNGWAFEWYVRRQNARDKLQAGTYDLSPSQSTQEIVAMLTGGQVATNLVTIVPGKRLDQIKAAFIASGFSEEAVDKALDPTQYEGHPTLADKPKGASLEGYLYPETFQINKNIDPSIIIRNSLDEFEKRLTPEIRAGIAAQGLTIHQAVILASIVEQEVDKPSDRAQAAQVFLKRLKIGMPLGSDVTAYYGAIINGQEPTTSFNSPYNTHLFTGLPAGSISNFSVTSLQAVAQPAQTDWLYFVSGDDGNTYFSRTLAEHEALAQKYCIKLCGR